MNLLENEEKVVVVVKHQGAFHWYWSKRDLWILDLHKWRQEFVKAGYDTPTVDASMRFGIEVVNEISIDQFLDAMRQFEIDSQKLRDALAVRFPAARSWWDVGKLFPIMFIDCDRRHVAAFYADGTAMERYIPDGWTSSFEDFASDYGEARFPTRERFWVQNGMDMLATLNDRGKELADE